MLLLKTNSREKNNLSSKNLRNQGLIPAVIYGHGVQSVSIVVPEKEFKTIYKQAGESSLIDLIIDSKKPVQALIHEIQYHPLKHTIEHIDFYQVKADEKITAEVELKFIGEPRAVKELGGILVTPTTKIKVECLPKDLVHEIEIDISKLQAFEDSIRLKDVIIPSGIKILSSLDEMIAMVKPPRSEEELKTLEEKPAEKVEEVTVLKEKAKEESGEGAVAAPTEKK